MKSFRQNKHHFCSMGSFHFSKHLLIGQCLCEWLKCTILLQHPWYHFNLFCITYLALRPHLPILFSPHFVKQKVLQISEMLLKKTLFDYWSTMIIIVKSQCMRLQFINDFIIKSKIYQNPVHKISYRSQTCFGCASLFFWVPPIQSLTVYLHCFPPRIATLKIDGVGKKTN